MEAVTNENIVYYQTVELSLENFDFYTLYDLISKLMLPKLKIQKRPENGKENNRHPPTFKNPGLKREMPNVQKTRRPLMSKDVSRKGGRRLKRQKPVQFDGSEAQLRGQNQKAQPKFSNQIIQEPEIENDSLCCICLTSHLQQELVLFSSTCAHSCCKHCLAQHINYQIKKFQPIKCFDSQCKETILKDSRHYQKMSKQQKKQYLKILNSHQILKYSNRRICPKTDCKGYIITDKIPFECVVCRQQFCKECLHHRHQGSCDDNGRKFLQNNLSYAKCNRCGMFVQKNQGCNHMTCLCGYQFCYLCSNAWALEHRCREGRNGPQRINDRMMPVRMNEAVNLPVRPVMPPPEIRTQRLCNCTIENVLLGLAVVFVVSWLLAPFILVLVADLILLTVGEIITFVVIIALEIVMAYHLAARRFYGYCRHQSELADITTLKWIAMLFKTIFPFWVFCDQESIQASRDRRQQYLIVMKKLACFPLIRGIRMLIR